MRILYWLEGGSRRAQPTIPVGGWSVGTFSTDKVPGPGGPVLRSQAGTASTEPWPLLVDVNRLEQVTAIT